MQTVIVICAVLLSIFALLLASGALYQFIGTWRDRRLFPPPGRLVRVKNRLMHIHATGESAPTVVFESGMGASCLSWMLVQPAVAEFSRAVSYDRAGHGWSDPAREPRTARQIAEELRALLDVAAVPGPYILVAHSFGGYVSRAFAHLYRSEVVGMVLVDSIYPAEWENPTPEQMRMVEVGLRYAGIAAWLARFGVVRLCATESGNKILSANGQTIERTSRQAPLKKRPLEQSQGACQPSAAFARHLVTLRLPTAACCDPRHLRGSMVG